VLTQWRRFAEKISLGVPKRFMASGGDNAVGLKLESEQTYESGIDDDN